MCPAGEQAEARGGLVDDLGLGQDAPADRDHRVGGEDIGAVEIGTPFQPGKAGFGLGTGEPASEIARALAFERALIEI